MKRLHMAAAQIHSGGGVEETLRRAERQIAAASAVGVEVILFSECALQGYDYDLDEDLVRRIALPADGEPCRRLGSLARQYGLAVMMGFFERDGDRYHNSQLVARPDGTLAVERKHALTGGELKAGLSPGEAERTVFTFNGVKTAIVICADGGIEGLYERLKEQGVQYRFCPTGGGGKMDEMLREADLDTEEGRKQYETNRPRVFKPEALLPEKERVGMGFTAANALGPVGRRTCHQGHCMIVDNRYVMRAQIPGTIVLEHQQDQMIHAELAFD